MTFNWGFEKSNWLARIHLLIHSPPLLLEKLTAFGEMPNQISN